MVILISEPLLPVLRFAQFWAKVDTRGGQLSCWRWRGTHNRAGGNGSTRRPRFRIRAGTGAGTHMYVARLILLLHDPRLQNLVVENNLEACHRPFCPNPWCINPYHLYWGTKDDNVRDRYPMRRPNL